MWRARGVDARRILGSTAHVAKVLMGVVRACVCTTPHESHPETVFWGCDIRRRLSTARDPIIDFNSFEPQRSK